MTLEALSAADATQSFGYHPDPAAIDAVFERAPFARALVIDAPVREIATRADECRTLRQTDVELPEGVYWFGGVDDGALVLHVPYGATPGAATVALVDELDDDHPLMAAWDWAEELWGRGSVVPVPRFDINDAAVTRDGSVDVVVRDPRFVSDQWMYTVTIDGRQQSVVESQLSPPPQLDNPRAWVTGEPVSASRFGATLTRAKLQGKFANTLFSFRATRTTFRPYQFKPVLKLLDTGKARLLIADEVGLGKTIEAGLIWTELEARQAADRVLIVCPSSLVSKWKEEMDERFGFELVELDNPALRGFLEKHQQNKLPARGAYICSLERLRTWDGIQAMKDVPPEFDLVIVDEAHSMRNKDTKSFALGTELADWAENLVFLTATPLNLRQDDLLNLLLLLAPEDYGDLHDLELRLAPNRIINAVSARLGEKGARGRELLVALDQLPATPMGEAVSRRPSFKLLRGILDTDELAPREIVDAKRRLAELNTLSTVITRTKKVEVDHRKAQRREDRQQVAWTAAEQEFYSAYLQWCRDRADAIDMPLHFAMQMPLRLASACLPMARRAVLDPESFGDLTDDDAGELTTARLVTPPRALVDAALRLAAGVDSKFDALRDVLDRLHGTDRRALLFTHSRPTLAYLKSRLETDFRVAVMHGGVDREDRRRIMAGFRAGKYDFVLANRVASEGLDFEFCSAVINYDLPWNPMEIEQRIGRIDRIGQPEKVILVVNFVNEQTIDERILSRLLDRIEIFESSIGALEPIIATNASKALQDGFDFTLTEAQREQKLHERLTAIEEQRAGLRDISDASSALLVSDDVDVAGLEEELIRTGRYIGQRELALLLDDWARVDGAPGIRFHPAGQTVELHGNPVMAARVDNLAKSAQRTRTEVTSIASRLRDETPISLVLDQELARTGGGTMLTATSPLAMAAAAVPGHRQARFASLGLSVADDTVLPGVYVVVLAKAESTSRGGDEIWGVAVTEGGRPAGEGPVDQLMAALAEGNLVDAPLPQLDRIGVLVDRAMHQLDCRHLDEQQRRGDEFAALQEERGAKLAAQHGRKIAAIETRIATALSRDRDRRMIALFESQRNRANERFDRLTTQLRAEAAPEICLEPLAVCVVAIENPRGGK